MSKPEVVPLTGRIGAEIRGVRLDPELDSSTAAAIRDAWLRHKVIFFRNQDHLDDLAQEGLAWIFGGASMAHPTVPAAHGTDYIYEVAELEPMLAATAAVAERAASAAGRFLLALKERT